MNAIIEQNIRNATSDNVKITPRGDGMYIAEWDGMTKWVAADETGAIVLPDNDTMDYLPGPI